MTTSVEVRQQLIDALHLDLVGPDPGDETYADETLPQAPSKWYLTGFLVPFEAPPQQKGDGTAEEQLDLAGEPAHGDDGNAPDQGSGRRAWFPSSMGMSVLLPAEAEVLHLTACWGDYAPVPDDEHDEEAVPTVDEDEDGGDPPVFWKRAGSQRTLAIPVPGGRDPERHVIPDSGGLYIVISARRVFAAQGLAPGTRSVSLFLVNHREPETSDGLRDAAYCFQARLEVLTDVPIVPRADHRGLSHPDWDEQVAAVQYREDYEYAVGHNVATHARLDDGGVCREVRTTWIPEEDVERVVARQLDDVDLRMDALAEADSAASVRAMVGDMVKAYAGWIAEQGKLTLADKHQADTVKALLSDASMVNQRIDDGLQALDDPQALEAFRIANRAIARAMRQRWIIEGKNPNNLPVPAWRPFQLAFLLMNLRGIVDPQHPDRETVDLLFFPTGGGKTEAYLVLAAFALVLRRLRHPGVTSAGVSVLMRYTLRLLTLDQLGRAAALICALELERQQDEEKLGPWPFEIGLWVGQTATPNRMGKKGDRNRYSARQKTLNFQKHSKRHPSPIPLEKCPWCGTPFQPNSFQLLPDAGKPQDLRVICLDRGCVFGGSNPLPLLAVDEPIYRRLPCFLIATVDKFAQLPWVGPTGGLFGKVERHDGQGFYGPCDPGRGKALPEPLQPPDLVIQDELHLISGPLGTMVGLYETAIDALATAQSGELVLRPKVVASTATVRRASRQLRALFGRQDVAVFPPPGPDRRDSFFAITVPVSKIPGRRYVGIAAQGRSLKVVLLRTYLALLGAGQKAWEAAGGRRNRDNPTDPYMTLLGYFNSLRELGGSRRIVEDEVASRLRRYGERMRVGETEGLFADRTIKDEPRELTSRVPTNDVAVTKDRLSLAFNDPGHVDVALATNMISVGLDITRLGLMVVLGQPKTAAEYIQASSRVGREEGKPGLVVTLLNVHRPRDRSHYERFRAWHRTFYRDVEATSVTPFSPRAVERGLAGVTVSLARHVMATMTHPAAAAQMRLQRPAAAVVADLLAGRAEGHDKELDKKAAEALRQIVKKQTLDLLDAWENIATGNYKDGTGLQYHNELGTPPPPLLWDPLDPDLLTQGKDARKFTASRSLRDVEPSVNLWLWEPKDKGDAP